MTVWSSGGKGKAVDLLTGGAGGGGCSAPQLVMAGMGDTLWSWDLQMTPLLESVIVVDAVLCGRS
ncbi:hypothetical protein E2C01_014886 [Portunus trituberculatus]|uniref:Uncharacterized protein n=1 Tax=Portunus trituberculatus TaxID=210409 RepID=A0A5B7DL63_PORTR|nr:hypothetical protein [Portunus trituberculatus]